MEPDGRGRPSTLNVKGFFSNLRHRRSKSRSTEPSLNPGLRAPHANATAKPPGPSEPEALGDDQQVREGLGREEPDTERRRLVQGPSCFPETAHESRAELTVVIPSVERHRSALWKAAYEQLRADDEALVAAYEAVLRDEARIPIEAAGGLTEQLSMVARAQRKKVENRQWQFQWFGHPQSVRDTIERILNITQKSAGLISVGMNQAPAYVSVPWSAITALVPLMMNEFKEHKGCLAGLEAVTRVTFSYQMAEEAFLGSDDTRDLYKKSVLSLYKKILEYQALSVRYFGRSTLQRLGKNIGAASTRWADMPRTLSAMDDETRRSLNFLGQRKGISALMAVYDVLSRQENEIKGLIQRARAKGDEVAEITRWASSVSVEHDHRDVRRKLGEAHYSSGRWFLEHPSLRAWRQWRDGCRCLWLKGGVGTGKSSLASILIEDLVRRSSGLVAFFYCSRKSDKQKGVKDESATARNDYENSLRSLVAQIAVSADGKKVYGDLAKRFEQDRKGLYAGSGLSRDECVEMLDAIFTEDHKQHFTIVIDALDECKDHDAFLAALSEAASPRRNVRLFFSSRLEVKVQEYFPEATCVDVGEQNSEDIEQFLKIEIPRRRPGSGITDAQVSRLFKAINTRAGGAFMWAKLQINLFLAEIKSQRIRLADDLEVKLLSLESSKAMGEELLYDAYGEVYQKAIGNDEQQRKDIVTTALQWVLSAFRTLTLRELAFAVSVKADGAFTRGIQEGLVMDLCSNLLVEDTTGAVRIAHLSVRHYLEARVSSDFVPEVTHHQAAITCLYFLTSPYVEGPGKSSMDAFKPKNTDVTLTKGFRVYVASYWSRHCREATKDEHLQSLVASASSMETSALPRRSTNMRDHSSTSLSGEEEFPATHAKHHDLFVEFYHQVNSNTSASDGEAAPVVERFIALGGDLGAQSEAGATLLHECVRLELDGYTKLLLDSGAPVDGRDPHGNTPLHVAAMHHGARGTQLLLLAGADKNATNLAGQTPLHVAVAFGCQEIAETLLSANVRGMERDIRGDSPMHYAAAMGATVLVETLLLMGYSPDGENSNRETALVLAVRLCHLDVVRALLDHGAVVRESHVVEARDSGNPALAELLSRRNSRATEPMRTLEGVSYDIEFEDETAPSRLCNFCDVARWVTASRKGTTYRHHASLSDLVSSATKGCPMCGLFRRDLQRPSPAGDLVDASFMVTLEAGSGQGSRPDRKDKLILSGGEFEVLTYELCIDEEDSASVPAINWISGTTVDLVPLAGNSIAKTSLWIDQCLNHHGDCWGDEKTSPALPTYILDVGSVADGHPNPTVRLVETHSTMTGRYAFLSARWDPFNNPGLLTKRQNLRELTESVPLGDLPPACADAITTTRRLGLRYLWIDRFCMVQDSEASQSQELSRTPEYLRNAFFVLVVASGDHLSSFLRPRTPPLLHMDIVQTETLTGSGPSQDAGAESSNARSHPETSQPTGRSKRARLYVRRPLETASQALGERVLKRAWMTQEAILPKRMLIVGKDQLYWHCHTALLSEGSKVVLDPYMKLTPRTRTPGAQRSFFPWYLLMNRYSESRASLDIHKLVALMDVALFFDPDRPFVEGLWADDFRNGMLWYAKTPRVRGGGLRLAPRPSWSPSWSWFSLGDRQALYNLAWGAQHDATPGGHALSVLRVQASTADASPWDYSRKHFSSTAYAEVRATVFPTAALADKGDCICFFDRLDRELEWTEGSRDVLFMLVCAWNPTPLRGSRGSFALGLILDGDSGWRDLEEHRGFLRARAEDVYARVGLFLMPNWEETASKGTRRDVVLV